MAIFIIIVQANVQFVKATEDVEIYRNEAGRAIKVLAKRKLQFNLIFLDPPYKMLDMNDWMIKLDDQGLIAEDAVIVVEHDAKVVYPEQFSSFTQLKHSLYGDIAVSIYRYEAI